jgi:hypothetical protein
VGDLEFAKVEEFVDSPCRLKTYGLASPAVRVDLFLGDNRARKTLLIGNKIDTNYYAKDEARDAVFKIKETSSRSLISNRQRFATRRFFVLSGRTSSRLTSNSQTRSSLLPRKR